MKTLEEINALAMRACEAGLQGREVFAQTDAETWRRAYNGIGPESFPEEWRDRITQHLDLFAPAALIHDLRFTESDGGRWGFNYANSEFHENCLALAAQKYPWYRHPLRRIAAREGAHVLYACVRSSAGWRAWIDAYEANMQTKGKGK